MSAEALARTALKLLTIVCKTRGELCVGCILNRSKHCAYLALRAAMKGE
jgi:hypothetical protein